MKSYFVFAHDPYHGHGGFADFAGRFERMEEVFKFLMYGRYRRNDEFDIDWQQIQIVEVTDNDIQLIYIGPFIDSFSEMKKSEENEDEFEMQNRVWTRNKISILLKQCEGFPDLEDLKIKRQKHLEEMARWELEDEARVNRKKVEPTPEEIKIKLQKKLERIDKTIERQKLLVVKKETEKQRLQEELNQL